MSVYPGLRDHRVGIALGVITFMALANLRGIKESGALFAVPTYLFVVSIVALLVWGLARAATGDAPVAESAEYEITAELGEVTGLALVLLALRAAAVGGVALTGLGTIVEAAPAVRGRPRVRRRPRFAGSRRLIQPRAATTTIALRYRRRSRSRRAGRRGG